MNQQELLMLAPHHSQNFWIFWISHENKKRRQHALARRVLRSVKKNMAI